MRNRLCLALTMALMSAPSGAAVSPEKVTLTWDQPSAVTPGLKYHFRLQHFAHPEWIDLGLADPNAGQLVYPFTPPLPDDPATDRWICADGQGVAADGTVGKWYSEANGSAACNQVDVGTIPVPPPPPPPTPTLDERLAAVEQAVAALAARPDRTADLALRQTLIQAVVNACSKSCSGTALARELKKLLEAMP